MMKKILLSLTVFICCRGEMYAQPSLASGNATGVGTGNVPTSGGDVISPDLFTGTVNVNIPIYSYSVDGLDLGISVGYNTGGIKVDQIASDVGLGWNLNIGGSITRVVHGIEDELTEDEVDTINSTTLLHDAVSPKVKGLWTDATNYNTEQQPDEFDATIGGKSFKFAISDYTPGSGTCSGHFKAYTVPKSAIQVDVFFSDTALQSNYIDNGTLYNVAPDNVGATYYFDQLGFKITDENGNQFFFVRGDFENREFSYTSFCSTTSAIGNDYWVARNWVLKKVITHNNAVIKYSYTNDFNGSYTAFEDQRVQENSKVDNLSDCDGHHVISPGNIAIIDKPVETDVIQTLPTEIDYPNGDVVSFSYSTGRADLGNSALSTISIHNGYDGTVSNTLKYRFNYAYFNSLAGGTAELAFPSPSLPVIASMIPHFNEKFLRLKLKGIDKVGTDNTTIEPYYVFGYNDLQLPPRTSMYQDCYGYYNGLTASAGSISGGDYNSAYATIATQLSNLNISWHVFTFNDGHATITANYGRSLQPSVVYTQADILTKVTNGLGGYKSFTYKDHILTNPPDFNTPSVNTGYFDISPLNTYPGEANRLYQFANDGVCIDNIVSGDATDPNASTTTSFNFNNGYRFFVGGYFFTPTEVSGRIYSSSTVTANRGVYQNTFVNPIDYVNGFNHGYSNAAVTVYGPSGMISDNEYTFTNILVQDNEQSNGTQLPLNTSRLKVPFGIGTEPFDRKFFEKQYLGLMKSSTSYDIGHNPISSNSNTYNEIRSADSIGSSKNDAYYSYTIGDCYDPYSELGASYNLFPNSIMTLSASKQIMNAGSKTIETDKAFGYDDLGNTRYVTWTDSKGISREEVYDYLTTSALSPSDIYGYTERFNPIGCGGTGAGSEPVYVQPTRYLMATTSYVNGNIVSATKLGISTYPFTVPANVTYAGSGEGGGWNWGVEVSGVGAPKFQTVNSFFSPVPLAYSSSLPMKEMKKFTLYDDHNNVLETQYNNEQKIGSCIWDNRIAKKIAEVTNAAYRDIAYTSFEGQFAAPGTTDYNKGNWNFDPSKIVCDPVGKGMTGKYFYRFGSSDNIAPVNTLGAKKYLLSFWARGSFGVLYGGALMSPTAQATVNGWTLYTAYIDGNGSSGLQIVKNSGVSGATDIDELRLLPAAAAMQTTTYEPLLGPGSQCDERNNIVYYEYDAMGRPTITRDINGNIISLTKTVVQGNDN